MTDDLDPGFYLIVDGQIVAHASETVTGPGWDLRADSPTDRAAGGHGWVWLPALT